MKKFLEQLSVYIVFLFSVLLLAICVYFSFLYSFTDKNTTVIRDNVFLQCICVGVLLIGILFLNHFVSRLYSKNRMYELIHVAITVMVICIMAFLVVRGMNQSPNSDALSIYNISKSFSVGNYDAYAPQDSYLALFPFQTSFVFLMELLMRITGKSGYLVFQYLNVAYFAIIVVSGYGIIKCQKRSERAVFPYLFLISTCAPLFLYMPNIYGDIPHLALMSFSLWILCLGAQAKNGYLKICTYTIGVLSAVVAAMYKDNVWILIVAYALCIMVELMRKWSWEKLAVALILVLAVYSISDLADYVYQSKTGRTSGTGIPTLAVIAMGMQENNGVYGGWNGFHSDTFVQTGYDYDATLEISRKSVQDSLEYFRQNPAYFFGFYKNKMIFQWAEAEYTSFYPLKISADRERAEWTESVLFGDAKERILDYMDIHQSVVYLMAFFFAGYEMCLFVRKKETMHFGNMVILVTFIGGFLFSLIWEAGARMALPYFVLLIPLASQGIGYIYDVIQKKEQICCRF